jgi:nucleoid-associated protein YgaU
MGVRISTNSRLRLGSLINFHGVEFWDLLVLPPVPEHPQDTEYTVVGGDRIDNMAYRFYGDPTLWFIIAVANGMELLPVDMNVGDIIRIPAKAGLPAYFATLVVP